MSSEISLNCLQLNTSEIKFQYTQNNYMKSILILTNITNQSVAFKLKATNPKHFLVKPNQGILEKAGSITIDLTMHPQVFENGLQNFSEKILLQAVPSNSIDIFKEIKVKIQQQKINIVIIGTNSQILTQSRNSRHTPQFESMIKTQSQISKSLPINTTNIDILKQEVQTKEEYLKQINKETTEYEKKLKLKINQSKQTYKYQQQLDSFLTNFAQFIFLVIIGYLIAVFRTELTELTIVLFEYLIDYIRKYL